MKIKFGLGKSDYKKQSNETGNFFGSFKPKKQHIKLIKRIGEGESCVNAIIGYKNVYKLRWVSLSFFFCFVKIYY